MKGVHIISSFVDCRCESEYLLDYKTVEAEIRKYITDSGMQVFDVVKKNFRSGSWPFNLLSKNTEQYGYSLMFGLLESHVSLHTFPEENSLLLDVFACHYKKNNTDKAKYVYDKLKILYLPKKIKSYKTIQR